MLIVNYLLTECEVIAGKSQTEALTCIDPAITDRSIAKSIHQGQGLSYRGCNVNTWRRVSKGSQVKRMLGHFQF